MDFSSPIAVVTITRHSNAGAKVKVVSISRAEVVMDSRFSRGENVENGQFNRPSTVLPFV